MGVDLRRPHPRDRLDLGARSRGASGGPGASGSSSSSSSSSSSTRPTSCSATRSIPARAGRACRRSTRSSASCSSRSASSPSGSPRASSTRSCSRATWPADGGLDVRSRSSSASRGCSRSPARSTQRARRQAHRRAARRAAGGARVTTAEKYVTAAYLVVLAVVLALRRHLRVQALPARAGGRRAAPSWRAARSEARASRSRPARTAAGMTEAALLLFWPALPGYAEAAVAYAGDTVRPGRLGRYAIWGVRLGWLAQTALLVAQACGAGRLPVGDVGRLAEPLRLDVRRRLSDLGLPRAVPAARARRHAARGRRCSSSRGRPAASASRRAPSSGDVFLASPRRPHPCRLRRLHPRRRPRGPLPLAGPPAEAARRRASSGCARRRSQTLDQLTARRSPSPCPRSRSGLGIGLARLERTAPPSTPSWPDAPDLGVYASFLVLR